MEDPDNKAELQRLIDRAVTPAKSTMGKIPTDPTTHVSFEDAPTGKWHLFNQTLHVTSRCTSTSTYSTSFLKIFILHLLKLSYSTQQRNQTLAGGVQA